MLRLAVLSARGRLGAFTGALIALFAAAVLSMAWGMQLESILHTHPPVERYAGATAVVTGQQKAGADHDVLLGERARASSALIARLAAVPGVRAAIGDVSVPAGLGGRAAVAHGWSSSALTPYVLSAGTHLLDLLRYHAHRPLEVESTGAALLTLGRALDPASAWRVASYGSDNVVGPADRFLLPLAGIAPLLAIAGILAWSVVNTRRALRREDGERLAGEVLVRAACATLAASMTLGKVFSAQYLAWLLPAGALVSVLDRGRRRRIALWLLGGAMLLTQLNQHLFFGILGSGPHPLMGALFLLRNGLLMSWAVWTLVPGPAERRSAVEADQPPMSSPGLPSPSRVPS